jgi:hypothetical protein
LLMQLCNNKKTDYIHIIQGWSTIVCYKVQFMFLEWSFWTGFWDLEGILVIQQLVWVWERIIWHLLLDHRDCILLCTVHHMTDFWHNILHKRSNCPEKN